MAPSSREALGRLFRICAAAHSAYRLANGSPHRADIVAMGADGSPTEELDRIVEAAAISVLDRERVPWNVLSEELGLAERGGDLTLVLDPIDGSHNALRRMPFASISVAVGSGSLDGIVAGVVHDLATGVTYWAERGGGAFRDGRPLRTRRYDPRHELFFLNLGRQGTPRGLDWAHRARRVRALGCASLEMTMVAQGSADAYLFENAAGEKNLRVTDIAAAYRILREAGGGCANAALAPIDDFPLELGHHTSVLAWGDPAFPAAAREQGYL